MAERGHRWIRLDPDLTRLAFAAARADYHDARERYLLELAVLTSDDDFARRLEVYAHDAYRDALSIAEEHELNR